MRRTNIIIPHYRSFGLNKGNRALYCPRQLSHALYRLQQRLDVSKHFQQWLQLEPKSKTGYYWSMTLGAPNQIQHCVLKNLQNNNNLIRHNNCDRYKIKVTFVKIYLPCNNYITYLNYFISI